MIHSVRTIWLFFFGGGGGEGALEVPWGEGGGTVRGCSNGRVGVWSSPWCWVNTGLCQPPTMWRSLEAEGQCTLGNQRGKQSAGTALIKGPIPGATQ